MLPEQYVRVKAIVAAALELPSRPRAAYLDEACGSDVELRAEVDSLLAQRDSPVLATGALGGAVPLSVPDDRSQGPPSSMPAVIGPYRVLAVLGEGGMGTVYRAEQTAPIRREVALKLVRRGLDTERIVRRFEQERQTLARMDHPNIARVLDAGASEDGRPYFVMELVSGMPITSYCRSAGLSTRARLELFLAILAGVQHAHQKGILHRDLKPSNIPVREQDGAPVPKIIDFGIAKALGDGAEPSVVSTQAGLMVGTPDYMSPEQAGVIDADVDTRADVYSLGVVLYELLTGARPYEFRTYSATEIQRVLGGPPPRRPSQVAGAHRRRLQGDLDNIVLKAIARAPADRYSSAEQLADDVRRHLDGLPVRARAATWGYRAGKFVRRHRTGVAFAATFLLLLAGSAALLAVQAGRLAVERDRARNAAATATKESDFLVGMFQQLDPSKTKGGPLTARDILDQGVARLRTTLGDEPEIRATLADTIGWVYFNLGSYEAAEPLLRQALALRRERFGNESAEVAESLDHVARVVAERGDDAKAIPLYREALAIERRLPESALLALTLNDLSNSLRVIGPLDEAERLSREALAMRERLLGPDAAGVAESFNDLAAILTARGKLDEALAFQRRALALDRRLHGDVDPVVAIDYNTLGTILSRLADYAGSEAAFEQCLSLVKKLYGPHHITVAHVEVNLGASLLNEGDAAGAEGPLVSSLALHRRLLGEDNRWVQSGLLSLGRLRRRQGRLAESETLLRESLTLARKVNGAESAEVADASSALGVTLERRGQLAEAERRLRQALALDRKVRSARDPVLADDAVALADFLRRRGRLVDAEPLYREALPILKRALPGDHPDIATALLGEGLLAAAHGRPEDAEPLLRRALDIRVAKLHAGCAEIDEARRALASLR
jgi:tetratricopeptide (TPR) repeat protein